MPHLVMLRHGQSQWNLENRFTGWVDVDITAAGEAEAHLAGTTLATLTIDAVFTSELKRAVRTALLALETAEAAGADLSRIRHGRTFALIRDQALNERDYGDLAGLNKAETEAKYGVAQVHLWRRSYITRPPGGESLADVVARVRPYFTARIQPLLEADKTVLVTAHGNSLRAMYVVLGLNTPEAVSTLELPTGVPMAVEFANGTPAGDAMPLDKAAITARASADVQATAPVAGQSASLAAKNRSGKS